MAAIPFACEPLHRVQRRVFLSADACSGLAILAEGGKTIGEDTISAYNHDYAQRDPFRRVLFQRSRTESPVEIFTDEELLPHEGLLCTDLYRDLLGPADLRHGTFAILDLSVRRFDVISIWRTPAEGPMAADSKRLLELLIPHVQTALQVRRVLGNSENRLANAQVMANATSVQASCWIGAEKSCIGTRLRKLSCVIMMC